MTSKHAGKAHCFHDLEMPDVLRELLAGFVTCCLCNDKPCRKHTAPKPHGEYDHCYHERRAHQPFGQFYCCRCTVPLPDDAEQAVSDAIRAADEAEDVEYERIASEMLMRNPEVWMAIAVELHDAEQQYVPFPTPMHGISVIREEFEELWELLREKDALRDKDAMRREAVQVAAMCVRFIIDCTGGDASVSDALGEDGSSRAKI